MGRGACTFCGVFVATGGLIIACAAAVVRVDESTILHASAIGAATCLSISSVLARCQATHRGRLQSNHDGACPRKLVSVGTSCLVARPAVGRSGHSYAVAVDSRRCGDGVAAIGDAATGAGVATSPPMVVAAWPTVAGALRRDSIDSRGDAARRMLLRRRGSTEWLHNGQVSWSPSH